MYGVVSHGAGAASNDHDWTMSESGRAVHSGVDILAASEEEAEWVTHKHVRLEFS
jgi:hypothetical protein